MSKANRELHAEITRYEKLKKQVKRKIDWYKSKHRTSEYFGGRPLTKQVKGKPTIIKRWSLT